MHVVRYEPPQSQFCHIHGGCRVPPSLRHHRLLLHQGLPEDEAIAEGVLNAASSTCAVAEGPAQHDDAVDADDKQLPQHRQ